MELSFSKYVRHHYFSDCDCLPLHIVISSDCYLFRLLPLQIVTSSVCEILGLEEACLASASFFAWAAFLANKF